MSKDKAFIPTAADIQKLQKQYPDKQQFMISIVSNWNVHLYTTKQAYALEKLKFKDPEIRIQLKKLAILRRNQINYWKPHYIEQKLPENNSSEENWFGSILQRLKKLVTPQEPASKLTQKVECLEAPQQQEQQLLHGLSVPVAEDELKQRERTIMAIQPKKEMVTKKNN